MSKPCSHWLYFLIPALLIVAAIVWLAAGPASSRVLAQQKPATENSTAATAAAKSSEPVIAGSRITAGALAGPIAFPAGSPLPQGCSSDGSCYEYIPEHPEAVSSVVRRWWPVTVYMTRSEAEKKLREANKLGAAIYVKPGKALIVPGVEAQPVVEKSIPAPPELEVRAVYMTGLMAGSEHGLEIVRRWREVGGNSVVFDIKDSDGSVNVPFDSPLAPHRSPAIPNLPKYVRFLHTQGMHAIARIALFRDENIAQRHSELAIHSRRTGQPWLENGKLVWSDPSNREMQQYDIALARQVAASGVDEVQFDYVRFPAEGDQHDARFAFETEHPGWTRAQVISDFLSHAYDELHKQGVLLSLDVFGVMAWQRSVDLAHTGQDIPQMARYCDVLSPMIYPSHFFGMDGYANPGDAPEHFISTSMQRFVKVTAGNNVVLRPWLQAFAWRTRTYSPEYIKTQVAVARANGGIGFLFWNARNDYSKPYAAMPEMQKAAEAKYFRGDQLADIPRLQAEHEKAAAEHAAAKDMNGEPRLTPAAATPRSRIARHNATPPAPKP
ncbi:MAG: hypothetical protein JO041_08245 [Acidobacteria bacterium]|nr:hypothetical protein [Acidobacteriota bacterium]